MEHVDFWRLVGIGGDECMKAGTHSCLHECLHSRMHEGIRACMKACIHGCMHACMHASMNEPSKGRRGGEKFIKITFFR